MEKVPLNIDQSKYITTILTEHYKQIDTKKSKVEGQIKVKLYKGNMYIVGRKSKKSVYSVKKSSFESGRIFSKKYIKNFIENAAKQLRK